LLVRSGAKRGTPAGSRIKQAWSSPIFHTLSHFHTFRPSAHTYCSHKQRLLLKQCWPCNDELNSILARYRKKSKIRWYNVVA
jgi:hypothetical protein